MRSHEVSDKLKGILKKLSKKDKIRYEATLKKIDQIMRAEDVNRYKNLSGGMKAYKRVHIDSHFVLVFRVKGDTVYFEDLDHHDSVY